MVIIETRQPKKGVSVFTLSRQKVPSVHMNRRTVTREKIKMYKLEIRNEIK